MKTKHHIQDWSVDSEVRRHWGYADRQMPCTNDPGSCAYLDEVYGAHDRGMIYVAVIWLTIVSVFLLWGVGRLAWPKGDGQQGGLARLSRAFSSSVRKHLLVDFIRPIFGRTTRLQVLILGVLTVYLTIWSFLGISYQKWITPVADMPEVYNTRTSLGPWSDRVGVIAYGLTPLSILLASRESLLSLITGIPYQHFNFLHRWTGYIILIQSILHTIGWCVIEIRLYQPQPAVAISWITQLYMIWGVVAMLLLLILYVLTLPVVIKRTGYEFFRKSHYILAMVYIGACIGHWKKLHCFLTPSIILWAIDRFIRLVRTYLIHRRAIGDKDGLFNSAQASIRIFPDADGDVVRLDLKHPHQPWSVGQHYYLCFTEGSIWQSHPFTPLNYPELASDGTTPHSYIFRAKGGETKKVANMLAEKQATTTPVILTGPYGQNITRPLSRTENVLCIAGGTGITYVLPAIIDLARRPDTNRKVELIWFIRHRRDIEWVKPELETLEAQDNALDLKIRIFTTRDSLDDEDSGASSSSEEKPEMKDEEKSALPRQRKLISVRPSTATDTEVHTRHPDIRSVVETFVQGTVSGPITVYASGPGPMMSGLREVIADCNSGSKVWKGDQRFDVSLECDERLEY